MVESFLQFILGAFAALGLTRDIPVVSAETLEEPAVLTIPTGETLYWVVAILDGDTLLVSGPERELFQVRLLAVDTNEINGPDSTAECYGAEATLFTTNFLENRLVRLTADPANADEDPYGRKLRYVDVLQEDGRLVSLNEALLLEGYATFPKQYPVTHPDHFENLEKVAEAEGKGLWSACAEAPRNSSKIGRGDPAVARRPQYWSG